MAPPSYRDDLAAVLSLMQQAGAIIRAQGNDDIRNMLWGAATDELNDTIVDPAFGPYDPDRLKVAFQEANRRFWERESRKVPTHLRLVSEREFDDLVREGA